MAHSNGYPLISPVTIELSQSSWAPRGDVLDHAWYRHVLQPSGKPHMAAIAILGRVVYMYRPTCKEIKNAEGLVVGTEVRQKFAADAWQCSREALADMFGFGVREVDAALVLLDKELGVVKRERRTVVINGVRCSNVLYLHLNLAKLKEISTPVTFERNSSPDETQELPLPGATAAAPKRKTNTKISLQRSLKSNNRGGKPPVVVFCQDQPPQNQKAAEALLSHLPEAERSGALLDLLMQCLSKGATERDLLTKINKAKLKNGFSPGKYLRRDLEAYRDGTDWDAAEKEAERQKIEQREAYEASKRVEAERQTAAAEASQKELLARQKRFFSLPEPERQVLEDLARRELAEWNRPNPDLNGLVSMALDILDGLRQPQVLSAPQ